jgi:signal transduction histidine kinase
MAETVETEATRLGNLASRLLLLARLDREEVHPQLEVLDMNALVADVVGQFKRLPSDRRISSTHEATARTAASIIGESITAMGDPELLRVALSQLLDNACRYSLPGSSVTVAVESQSDSVLVRVNNDGSTIPASEQSRIFERFYRGADARRFTFGTGLGLYVARKIALAHGGHLDLDDDFPAEGVTFCLTLPTEN